MNYRNRLLRLLLGGGWWTLWYGLFYLIVITGNFVWFSELYEWTIKGESGPAALGILIGLISFGGLPLLLFSFIHFLLAWWRGADSHKFMILFGLTFILLLISWMIICPLCVADALFWGFVAYYACLLVFVFVNLALLWATRQRVSLKVFFSF